MRILLVSNHGADRTYGGAERYVGDLAEALTARGHEVRLLSAFPVRDASAAQTVTLHATDWREDRVRRARNHVDDWVSSPRPRVGELLDEIAPDLVHTNNLPGISTGIWEQSRRRGIPVVHTLHDYHLLCPRTNLLRADGSPCRPNPLLCGLRARRLARWGDGVRVAIGVSAHVLGRHEAFFPRATEGRVIYHPLTALGPAQVRRPAVAAPATLGYLGVLKEQKGVRLLLAAAPRLAAAGITVRIAGHGELAAEVQANPHVRYEGQLVGDGVAAFLTGCDLGVVPSLWEEPGLTYVLYEWLAAARPALVTRQGGLAEGAALGGVRAFEPTEDALVEAIQDLQGPGRWSALVAGLPTVDGDSDLARWTDEHLAAYDSARS